MKLPVNLDDEERKRAAGWTVEGPAGTQGYWVPPKAPPAPAADDALVRECVQKIWEFGPNIDTARSLIALVREHDRAKKLENCKHEHRHGAGSSGPGGFMNWSCDDCGKMWREEWSGDGLGVRATHIATAYHENDLMDDINIQNRKAASAKLAGVLAPTTESTGVTVSLPYGAGLIDAVARAGYGERTKAYAISIPRLGIRTLPWDELPEEQKETERKIALAVLEVRDRMLAPIPTPKMRSATSADDPLIREDRPE